MSEQEISKTAAKSAAAMTSSKKPLLLDLHIPYTIRPMNFLSYLHLVGSNMEKNMYLTCLGREILSYEEELEDYEIRAVRLSGGSASVMHPDLLGRVLSLARQRLPVAHDAEVSYDALPNTIGTPSLTGIASGHPTRAELMMRSENDAELRLLGAPFTMQHTRNAMLFFQKFHLNNVGLTVNYGIPGQSMHSWKNTLHACTIMRPGHITTAPLDAVSLEDAQKRGLPAILPEKAAQFPAFPNEAARLEQYDYACSYLTGQGYLQYGTGLFCLPGHEYRFEALLRNGTPCIGMGLDARSYFEGYWIRNTNNLGLYLKNAGNYEKLTAEVRTVEPLTQMRCYVLGRLTLTGGLDPDAFREKFGVPLPDELLRELTQLQEKGWAAPGDPPFVLTREGQFHEREVLQGR